MIDKNKIKFVDGQCECCGCYPEELDGDIPDAEEISNDQYSQQKISTLLHQRNMLLAFVKKLASDRTRFPLVCDANDARELLREIE